MTSQTAASLRDAALIFLAATILGIAYNSMSPLGVRAVSPPIQAPTPAPAVSTPARGIQNETLSLTIEASTAAAIKGPSVPNNVTWPQAKALVEKGALLVDTREPQAYEAGHITGAVSLPMNRFEAEIAAFKSQNPPDRLIIVYCTSSQCAISRTMAQLLMERHGFTDVRDMPGGYAEWRLAEYAAAATPK